MSEKDQEADEATEAEELEAEADVVGQPQPPPTAIAKREGDRDAAMDLLGKLFDKVDDVDKLVVIADKVLGRVNVYDTNQLENERKRRDIAFEDDERRARLALDLKTRDPDKVQARINQAHRRWLRWALVVFAIIFAIGAFSTLLLTGTTTPMTLLLIGISMFCVVMIALMATDRRLAYDGVLRVFSTVFGTVLGRKRKQQPQLPAPTSADPKENTQ